LLLWEQSSLRANFYATLGCRLCHQKKFRQMQNTPFLSCRQYAILWGATILLWAVYCYALLQTALHSSLPDFQAYRAAASAFLHSGDVYGERYSILDTGIAFQRGLKFYYPPTFLLLVGPFLTFSLETSLILFSAVNLLLIPLLALILTEIFRPQFPNKVLQRPPLLFMIFLFLIAFFPPVWNGMSYGQVHLFIALGITLYFYFLGQNRLSGSAAAGFVLAGAVHIKCIPIVLILLPIFRRRWSLPFFFLLFSVLILFGGMLFGVLPTHWNDFLTLMISFPEPDRELNNYALSSILLEIPGVGFSSAKWTQQIVIGGIFLFLLFRQAEQKKGTEQSYYLIGLLLLLPPFYWTHYATWLLPLLLFLYQKGSLTGAKLIGIYAFFYFIDPMVFFAEILQQRTLASILKLSVPLLTLALSLLAFRNRSTAILEKPSALT
ncbi:DUF2029 domain-containing protein, partial [bacterium]|nr:DUF2029 domain-containing protein [bacterium]